MFYRLKCKEKLPVWCWFKGGHNFEGSLWCIDCGVYDIIYFDFGFRDFRIFKIIRRKQRGE